MLLLGKENEDELRKGLATIERNAKAQAQIIEDLLDMSRIISGKVRLEVQKIDLPAVLEESIETVRAAADAKSIRIQPVIDPHAAPVSGDRNRLQQIFWNLLTNAIKFTPKGGRVQVLLERVNSHIEVSVIDNGEGIDPEFLPHIFDRFQQADGSTTRRHGGLGLGLAIVKQLVGLHGGNVRAKRGGAGQGSTFIIDLPLMVVHSEPDQNRRHPRAASASSERGTDTSLEGVRVLVVDDETDARNLVKRILEISGATVTTAPSCAAAMESLRREKADVLISDIGMPDEDGYSLGRRVRELDPRLPMLALTAYARAEDRTKAIRAGFDNHLSKPVDAGELLAVVENMASRSALSRRQNG